MLNIALGLGDTDQPTPLYTAYQHNQLPKTIRLILYMRLWRPTCASNARHGADIRSAFHGRRKARFWRVWALFGENPRYSTKYTRNI